MESLVCASSFILSPALCIVLAILVKWQRYKFLKKTFPMKLIKFNYFCMVSVMLTFFKVTNTMEAEGEIIMDDAMRHYEEDGLLDPDRTKFSELKKVINEKKTQIGVATFLGGLFGGGIFNQILIPQIDKNENMSIFKWIKEHPKTSTAVAATVGGVGFGATTTLNYVVEREQKRGALERVKELEVEKERIINNHDLDDVVREIRIDLTQELLDKAILKYKGY